jgi:hypothetical protein
VLDALPEVMQLQCDAIARGQQLTMQLMRIVLYLAAYHVSFTVHIDCEMVGVGFDGLRWLIGARQLGRSAQGQQAADQRCGEHDWYALLAHRLVPRLTLPSV